MSTTTTHTPPATAAAAGDGSPLESPDDWKRYRRAFLNLRLGVGLLGVALPAVLFVCDAAVLKGSVTARGSVSAYYHTGVRDLFVGALMVIGVFLVTYHVTKHRHVNWITTIAGVACVGVALFPTEAPPGEAVTPWQVFVGEGRASVVHVTCAVVFVVLLAVMSALFGWDAKKYESRGWAAYHYLCAAVIVASCLFIVVTQAAGVLDDLSIYIGESVAVLAFGASWLSKGLERRPTSRGATPVPAHVR